MAVLQKCIFVLFAVLCLMQCVQMARMRREDTESNVGNVDGVGGLPALSGTEIGSAIDALVGKLKAALDDDTMKEVIASATKVLSEGTKKLQEHIDSIKNQE